MAKGETDIVHNIMLAVAKAGGVCWKNVRGSFWTIDKSHRVKAGLLCDGASDLIGFIPVVVTQEMVGQTVAVFYACEVKTASGRIRPEQENFINQVRKRGGKAGVARNIEDAIKITLD